MQKLALTRRELLELMDAVRQEVRFLDLPFYTIPEWKRLAKCGFTKTYELIANGQLKAKKFGTTTLIDGPSARALLASLPDAPRSAPATLGRPNSRRPRTNSEEITA
jgi:hypothetical protein